LTGALAAAPSGCGILPADRQLVDGDSLQFGDEVLRALHTPGHTAGSMSYLWRDCVFTGDCLLIDGCGRTDFQSGDAGLMYDSITERLFTLPDETLVYPAHDYHGLTMSSIGHEKRHNARLAGRSREEFIALMASLQLPRPRMMDVAVPANRNLGLPHAA
jgi:glyoxylase-like metal-dependent hydrolase (beta-lactamase superfamily II)